MRLVVNLDQLFHRDMRVDLRGREPRMTQQFLDVAQVRPAVQQVCRERMAQGVRTDVVMPAQMPMYFSTIRPTERVVILVP